MNVNAWLSLKQGWGRRSHREQQMLLGMVGLVLSVLVYLSIWQPARHRLEVAERQYRQQAELSVRIRHAEPARASVVVEGPLSVRVNDSATAAGLDIAQMEVDGDSLRLAIRGDAGSLLHWLDQQEREGAMLQSLTLEVENGVLVARMVLRQ
ncbi:type II secretion system protein M [Pseudomonas citri]|uniref:type II secretion system protein M n=1 Tax=Pseudomonas citri TaxID=2978349 RepID=UPI0021B656B3|nr:type II secretion system protein M [Pseudomonas citri]